MIVVDTNILFYLFVEGARSRLSEEVIERDRDCLVPRLWRSEFRNALATSIRAGFLDLREALQIMADCEHLISGNEYDVASDDVLQLSAETGCSAYDAEFVVLAQASRALLVTSDRELLEKFSDTAVSPERFLAR